MHQRELREEVLPRRAICSDLLAAVQRYDPGQPQCMSQPAAPHRPADPSCPPLHSRSASATKSKRDTCSSCSAQGRNLSAVVTLEAITTGSSCSSTPIETWPSP